MNMHISFTVAILAAIALCTTLPEVRARMADGRRGEIAPLPEWNNVPPSRYTHRNKGDLGDIDARGSVRYNIGPDGRILRGIITKHREVPVDDIGTGLDQARGTVDLV